MIGYTRVVTGAFNEFGFEASGSYKPNKEDIAMQCREFDVCFLTMVDGMTAVIYCNFFKRLTCSNNRHTVIFTYLNMI